MDTLRQYIGEEVAIPDQSGRFALTQVIVMRVTEHPHNMPISNREPASDYASRAIDMQFDHFLKYRTTGMSGGATQNPGTRYSVPGMSCISLRVRYEQATSIYNECYTRVKHRTESRIRSYAILDVEINRKT